MRKLKLALIVFAALISLAPYSAQSQTIDCGTQQRRELAVTVVDHNDAIIDSLRRGHFAVVSFSHKANNNPVLTSDFDSAKTAIDQIHIEAPPGYVGGGVVVSSGDVNGQGKLRVEITQPDIRSIKPILAYKRFEITE